MAPFPIEQLFGPIANYLVYLLIGIAFGAVLEMSGFADTNKLAAQFYFKEMTVLKVMFTAIVTAMVLIFLASGLGLLDFTMVWVNPTYLWPGIVGGLIMGFGFIIGGFCPGTSLVAASTLKIDGMFFVIGAFSGIFIFGETVEWYDAFWHSSYMGRFMLPEWLGLPSGVVVVLVVLMALFMFWGAEKLEQIFGKDKLPKEPNWRFAAAGGLVLVALILVPLGQPDLNEKWSQVAPQKDSLLTSRAVYMHPAEVAHVMMDDQINLVLADLRDEDEYNVFHVAGARRLNPNDVGAFGKFLADKPANTVVILMDDKEARSTRAWKYLTALKFPNAYILDGGIDNWLTVFDNVQCKIPDCNHLAHLFNEALGDRYQAAEPDPEKMDESIIYMPKLRLKKKPAIKKGGCG